ncbi:hypothetical protein CEP54_016142 [Fusarium duplospermum]|uniref:Nephrocystin 3-like N-terminal domain-containing protein n=1 Tax=Fusarium duplospermum TaxID=1325734 RepID=A0A428NHU2_9HYPO|nr:hypothetical protein CEP54_016142 [Fusarium duplospermum]
MTAAACTKDLLANITTSRVQAERKLLEVVGNIVAAIEDTKVNTERTIVHLVNDRDNEILDWLTPFDYASFNNFHQWLDTTEKTLFCTGIPGAGKTIMTSIVVDNLQQRFRDEPTLGLAYVYCDDERRQEQTPDHMFASILKQLGQRYFLHFTLTEAVRELYHQHLRTQSTTKSKVRPLLTEIMTCLPSVVGLLSKVYIVVDALDELQVSRDHRSVFLKQLLAMQESTGVKILATSRKIPDIQNYFKDCITCEIAADEGDIQHYVEDQLQHMPDFVQSDATLRDKIQTTISQNTRGMFSVAVAHLKTLAEQPTAGNVELVLRELPQDFYDIYAQSYQRIERKSKASRRLAEETLARLHAAGSLVYAPALQRGITGLQSGFGGGGTFVPSIDMMISVCEGLLSYDNSSKTLSLAHQTLEWYLDQRNKTAQSNAADKPRPKFNFGGGKRADDVVRPVTGNPFANPVARSRDDARETGEEYRSVAFSFGKKSTGLKADFKDDPTLGRNMSWSFVSCGSLRLGESQGP